ncbi:MAG: ATP-binding protein [Patescibacteria group bacterium]
MKSIKYIQIDDQKGALYSAKKQSLLIPVAFIKVFDNAFANLVGREGANLLLYKFGQSIGISYAGNLETILEQEKTEVTKEIKIKMSCNAIFMEAGWGRINIRKINLSEKLVEVEIFFSPSVSFAQDSNYSLERGIISGIYQQIMAEESYCKLLKKNDKNFSAILRTVKEIPPEIKEREKIVLVTRKKLEEIIAQKTKALTEEQVKTRAALVSLTDGLIVLDRRSRISLVNPEAEAILELQEKDALDKRINEISDIPNVDKLYKILGKKIHYTEKARELFFEKPSEKYFQVKVTPVVVGEVAIGKMISLHDISQDKEIEKAKTEFVSIASHQLRTPLTAMNWNAEMLISEKLGTLNKNQKEYLDMLHESARRMIRLVGSLLDVSHIELGTFVMQFKPTDIVKIAEGATDDLRSVMKQKNIKFTEHFDVDIPKLKLDGNAMRIVFQNLLTNAVIYTPANGKISLEIKKQKNDLFVAIKDNGYGIPKNAQKNIFGKIFRADNTKEYNTVGSGLGLYVSKFIIDKFKGKIWFESELNKGTTFYFTLPYKPGKLRKEVKLNI